MIRWVVTGPMGAGKSTVTALLVGRGAVVVDGDKLGHQVLADPAVVAEIVARFGPEVAPDGRVDRSLLGPRVFGNPDDLAALNAITHGRISALAARRLDDLAAEDNHELAVLEAAVYFLFPSPPLVDLVISVLASQAVRTERLVKSRNLLPVQVQARLAAQAELEGLWLQADVVLDNSGSLDQLRFSIDDLLAKHFPAGLQG